MASSNGPLPSHQKGECKRKAKCNQLHVKPHYIQALRDYLNPVASPEVTPAPARYIASSVY